MPAPPHPPPFLGYGNDTIKIGPVAIPSEYSLAAIPQGSTKRKFRGPELLREKGSFGIQNERLDSCLRQCWHHLLCKELKGFKVVAIHQHDEVLDASLRQGLIVCNDFTWYPGDGARLEVIS